MVRERKSHLHSFCISELKKEYYSRIFDMCRLLPSMLPKFYHSNIDKQVPWLFNWINSLGICSGKTDIRNLTFPYNSVFDVTAWKPKKLRLKQTALYLLVAFTLKGPCSKSQESKLEALLNASFTKPVPRKLSLPYFLVFFIWST